MVLAWPNHEAQTGGSGFGFEGLKKNDPGIEAEIEAESGLPYTPIGACTPDHVFDMYHG